MSYKSFPILFLLLASALGAEAQQVADGPKVKCITFDREQVKIEYVDGRQELVSENVTVRRTFTPTGVKAAETAERQNTRQWYTVEGRVLQSEPQQKGVYVVRNKQGIKKTVKK